jgi:hypothetical protein
MHDEHRSCLVSLFVHHRRVCTCFQMSLQGKKGRDATQLPTLSYDIQLTLPTNVDSHPQEISFLDLIANDIKFVGHHRLSID